MDNCRLLDFTFSACNMKSTPDYDWTNLHQNVAFQVEQYYELWNRSENGDKPSTFLEAWAYGIAQFKSVLKEAEKNNKKVRVIGGGWSLSDIQRTTDYFINANPLNLIQVGLKAEHVQAGIEGDLYCLSQCGASVMEINEQLRLHHRALSTSGASDGQSIVGAISTGTHGSAFGFGAMCDFVEGLHIIVSDALHYWVEGTRPVVTDAFVEMYMPGSVRINDDSVLNAAIVSFGSFGAIHAILLKVEPIYELEQYRDYFNWDLVKQSLNGPSHMDSFGFPVIDPFHFSIIVNPYKRDTTVVTSIKKNAFTEGNQPPVNNPGFGPSDEVLHLIGELGDLSSCVIPQIMEAVDKLIKQEFKKIGGDKSLPGWVFAGGTASGNGKAYSVELGVDASQVAAAADVIFGVCQKTPFPGLIAFRYVKKTKTTLGFTKYPVTCAIEFPATFCKATRDFYEAMYESLDQAGIEYTFHWGQCNNLNAANVRAKYGDAAVESWINARHTILTSPQHQSMFSNDFLQRLQLDSLSVPPADPILAKDDKKP